MQQVRLCGYALCLFFALNYSNAFAQQGHALQVDDGLTHYSMIKPTSGALGVIFTLPSVLTNQTFLTQGVGSPTVSNAWLQGGNLNGTGSPDPVIPNYGKIGTLDNVPMTFVTNGLANARMVISAAGNIGIGSAPTSGFQLEINDGAPKTSSGTPLILISNDGPLLAMNFAIQRYAAPNNHYEINAIEQGSTWRNIVLQTGGAGAVGFVGIGTNNPPSLFTVGTTNAFTVNNTGNIVGTSLNAGAGTIQTTGAGNFGLISSTGDANLGTTAAATARINATPAGSTGNTFIGNATGTLTVVGATLINNTGSAATTIGNGGATTNLNSTTIAVPNVPTTANITNVVTRNGSGNLEVSNLNVVSGSGNFNTIAKWTTNPTGSVLGNSNLSDNGTTLGYNFFTLSAGQITTLGASFTNTSSNGRIVAITNNDASGGGGNSRALDINIPNSPVATGTATGIKFSVAGPGAGTSYDMLGTASSWRITNAGDASFNSLFVQGGAVNFNNIGNPAMNIGATFYNGNINLGTGTGASLVIGNSTGTTSITGSNWSVTTAGLGTFAGLNPKTDATYDLGTAALRWGTVYTTTVSNSGTSLTLQQTGDAFGTSQLSVQNRLGSSGIVVSQVAAGDLADVGFKAGAAVQNNIRFDARAAFLKSSNNTLGEFQYLMDATNVVPALTTYTFAVGKNSAWFGENVGIGVTNAPSLLSVGTGATANFTVDASGNTLAKGSVAIGNGTPILREIRPGGLPVANVVNAGGTSQIIISGGGFANLNLNDAVIVEFDNAAPAVAGMIWSAAVTASSAGTGTVTINVYNPTGAAYTFPNTTPFYTIIHQ